MPIGELVQMVLQKGSKGPSVTALQQALIALGYGSFMPSGADGDFGDETVAAVSAFQAASGIAVDGVVGTDTRSAIQRAQAGGVDPKLAANAAAAIAKSRTVAAPSTTKSMTSLLVFGGLTVLAVALFFSDKVPAFGDFFDDEGLPPPPEDDDDEDEELNAPPAHREPRARKTVPGKVVIDDEDFT